MSNQYIGEIRLVSWNFAPRGWLFCAGQLLSIAQNQALFSLLGTAYGGDGVTNFALPDLQGRVPIHTSSQYPTGSIGGEVSHTLNTNEMPAHTHQLFGTKVTGTSSAVLNTPWVGGSDSIYGPVDPAKATTLQPTTITQTGGSQPHENRQPYLALNYVICTQGIYPSRN